MISVSRTNLLNPQLGSFFIAKAASAYAELRWNYGKLTVCVLLGMEYTWSFEQRIER